MSKKIRWIDVSYEGCAKDSKLRRRDKLTLWMAGESNMQVFVDGEADPISPEDVDWRGMTRLRGAGEDARKTSVLMRVSTEERALLARAAENSGQPLTTWMRSAGLVAARVQVGPGRTAASSEDFSEAVRRAIIDLEPALAKADDSIRQDFMGRLREQWCIGCGGSNAGLGGCRCQDDS